MNREQLRYRIAEIGYSMGFGSKKHFASFGILEKLPTYFGVATSAMGVVFLRYKNESVSDIFSILTIIVGFGVTYLNFYTPAEKEAYANHGNTILNLYYKVRSLFDQADTTDVQKLKDIETELNSLYLSFQTNAIQKQVFGSGVFAHFKLFCESRAQSKWFVDELKLTFWKDMVPETTKVLLWTILVIGLVFVVGWGLINFTNLPLILKCVSEL